MSPICSLADAVKAAGGPTVVAERFGISTQALYRFTSRGFWPRTEFTGETDYSQKLTEALVSKGVDISADTLRELGRRSDTAA